MLGAPVTLSLMKITENFIPMLQLSQLSSNNVYCHQYFSHIRLLDCVNTLTDKYMYHCTISQNLFSALIIILMLSFLCYLHTVVVFFLRDLESLFHPNTEDSGQWFLYWVQRAELQTATMSLCPSAERVLGNLAVYHCAVRGDHQVLFI